MSKISYELAKELKAAGLGTSISADFSITYSTGETIYGWREPTLTELIEACGPKHPECPRFEFCLILSGVQWCAGYMDENMETALPIEKGSTPEEAVARLWLALNPKDV